MRNRILLFGVAAIAIAAAGFTVARAGSFPDPPKVNAPAAGTSSVVLAGGCFWGMQGIFEHMKGVTNTVVGLRRRHEGNGALRYGRRTQHRPCRIHQNYLGSDEDHIRRSAEGLFLGGARSHYAEPPALRRGAGVPVRDLLYG